ncbi:hypothetical protein [Methylobacterium sp. R2-1]|uniref:hypothetical protein n=1 Tax=Methylobacterium sp. R2-1 TaxID=2587064 RepID=UPI00160A364E|nr:hypothetical protein [Methylobacterium sp. R2-1]MBB2962191.1 hypothetical protein [Methylobacterium sp. R2-1]
MSIAKVRESDEQWIELPEPDLERYLLRSRRQAANDNRRSSAETFRAVQVGACVALIGAATLIGALV